jgi:hypothetical protein
MLTFTQVDLVNPKHNLLPLTEDLVSLFRDVVWQCIDAPSLATSTKKKKRNNDDLILVDCFYISAVARDPVTNGLAELRQYLHAASTPRPWDSNEEEDEEEEEEDDDEDDDDDFEFDDDEDDDEEDDDDDDDDEDDDDDVVDHKKVVAKNKKKVLTKTTSSSVYDSVHCELDDVEFATECIREKIFAYVHQEVCVYRCVFLCVNVLDLHVLSNIIYL